MWCLYSSEGDINKKRQFYPIVTSAMETTTTEIGLSVKKPSRNPGQNIQGVGPVDGRPWGPGHILKVEPTRLLMLWV